MATKYHRLTIDLESEAYKQLQVMADQEERSVSKQGKVLILKALDDLKAEQKAHHKHVTAGR